MQLGKGALERPYVVPHRQPAAIKDAAQRLFLLLTQYGLGKRDQVVALKRLGFRSRGCEICSLS